MKKSTASILAIAASLALAACNGPWNMQPDEGPRDPKLWVSMLLVADLPLDTLWMERPVLLSGRADPGMTFVDEAVSQVAIVEPEAGDTLRFRPVAGRAAAWVAHDTAYRVKRGARYLLDARLRWNASKTFPAGAAWRVETLTAETRVPATYALDSQVQVPAESLHPSLAVGLPEGTLARARTDKAYRKSVYDSLNTLPGIRSLASRGVDEADFAAYLEGRAVYRPMGREDTLYFIYDTHRATDYSGNTMSRFSLPFLFTQKIDKRDFGGLILSQRFDSTGARIVDPMHRGILASIGADVDSVAFYQRGAVRPMYITGSYFSDIKGYPDTLRLANMLWGYTGRNVLHSYSVDPLYYQYYKGLIGTGAEGGGGLGGGSSRPQNVLRYSNIGNGDGFFTGAAADSFAINIRALRDTIPISALRDAWLRSDLAH
ncbi:MAG: hypothetical protein JWP91_2565 [Fibrobacteres bacterium]|nr:hypothetical protein [Fibrobacterota bacterium]